CQVDSTRLASALLVITGIFNSKLPFTAAASSSQDSQTIPRSTPQARRCLPVFMQVDNKIKKQLTIG
ncbi:MAG: hypothetical protein OEL68_08210, partial [Desulfobulbaceae bacterium]|nr:hypothetical protein [Desulfobulbaceae bacterium]